MLGDNIRNLITGTGRTEQIPNTPALSDDKYDALVERLAAPDREDPSKLLAFFAKTEPVHR